MPRMKSTAEPSRKPAAVAPYDPAARPILPGAEALRKEIPARAAT